MRLLGRRGFIAGLTAAALGLRPQQAWSEADPAARLVLRVIAARAGYVRVEDGDRARFAANYLDQRRWMVTEVQRSVSFLRLYETRLFPILAPASDLAKVRALERDIVTAFLLGTGFFESPDARELTYRGLRAGACRNPFARLD
ncbi:MAG TPA: hypothetical protein VHM01_02920 [Alphaproteobacteria bacterium]|nr:hypothetical protein [Alphaproteobacteria bacterium]